MGGCILADPSVDIGAKPKARKTFVVPPTFGELGKACRDVFGGGYNFGFYSVDFKTKMEDSVEVKAGGSLCGETQVFSGNMSTSCKMKNHGLNFTEKWNTSSTLGTEISVDDKLAEGLKLGLETSFSTETGGKTFKLKSQYKMQQLALTADVDIVSNGPALSASTVYAYDSWLMGYQMAFDSSTSEMTKNNFAFGYSIGDFVLHTGVNNLKEYLGSIYRKVNPQLETGIHLAWQSGDSNVSKFGIGCKYDLDENISLRAKLDENCGIGLSFQNKIRDGVTCTMSVLINGKNINEGGHKIGMSLDLEA